MTRACLMAEIVAAMATAPDMALSAAAELLRAAPPVALAPAPRSTPGDAPEIIIIRPRVPR